MLMLHILIEASDVIPFLLFFEPEGKALLVNLHQRAVLHHFNFKCFVYDLKFSPNGR